MNQDRFGPRKLRMVTRPATREDIPEIARLHIASWRATYIRELPPEFLAALDVKRCAAGWEVRLAKGIHVLVAEEAEALAGFVAFGPAHDPESFKAGDWEIHNIHVEPSRHGQGIGHLLFEQAVAACREHGATGLMLWVVGTNAGARAFYDHLGMCRDGGKQDHCVQPGIVLHEIRYRMPL